MRPLGPSCSLGSCKLHPISESRTPNRQVAWKSRDAIWNTMAWRDWNTSNGDSTNKYLNRMVWIHLWDWSTKHLSKWGIVEQKYSDRIEWIWPAILATAQNEWTPKRTNCSRSKKRRMLWLILSHTFIFYIFSTLRKPLCWGLLCETVRFRSLESSAFVFQSPFLFPSNDCEADVTHFQLAWYMVPMAAGGIPSIKVANNQ